MENNDSVVTYSPSELRKAKQLAKAAFIEAKGLIGVKVLSRRANIPQAYIRKWVRDEKWDTLVVEQPGDKVVLSPHTKEVLKSAAEEFGLSEEEELYCLHYMRTFNQTTAAIRAGATPLRAHSIACAYMRDEKIQAYLHYIKQQRNEELFLDAMRVIDEYMKIAFADMTDYVSFGPNGVSLRSSQKVDGQLITKIKEGKDGVSIELADKMKALDMLTKYLRILEDDSTHAKNPLLMAVKDKMMKRVSGEDNG